MQNDAVTVDRGAENVTCLTVSLAATDRCYAFVITDRVSARERKAIVGERLSVSPFVSSQSFVPTDL